MTCKIAPSILSFSQAAIAEPTRRLMAAGADWIHFDVMDGQFVPPITFGAALVASLRTLGNTPFEAHLMTLTPERHFEAFAKAGCRRITFHAEATHHAYRLAQSLHAMGLEAGLAINPATAVGAILPCLDTIDLALVMTVNPGWGGQKFIASTLAKVRKLREVAPDLEIEVDGGIDPDTLPIARAAGANVFVAGHYLASQDDPAQGLACLRKLCA
ncbi:MAG: ribulose-phosphate 3-epimerase [Fimbriimonas ginsengisoli]|uniref:Ribulose-phosphate 3-epimerase n=1 Tax=Fimbriimonas ginsengisoli TaxID=1005039 RepID=A0A931PUS5_FIMGI|nr:ribulose-phosphate 3-epimerase [Fimbriimonas ginsengisoli]